MLFNFCRLFGCLGGGCAGLDRLGVERGDYGLGFYDARIGTDGLPDAHTGRNTGALGESFFKRRIASFRSRGLPVSNFRSRPVVCGL